MARSTHTLFFFVLATALLISSLSFGHAEAAPTPISFGQTMTESISIQGEQDSFTFMGATGDVILVRVTTETVLWPQLDLYDPEGSLLESALEVGPCVVEINSSPLPTDGYYQLRISDYIGTGTGTYWVFVQRLNNPGGATQMEFGSTLSATITNTCEEDTYRFDATQGDTVQVRATSNTGLNPAFQVYGPDGSFLTENFAAGPAVVKEEIQIDESGTYTLIFKDGQDILGGEYGTETGFYWIFIQRLNNPGLATQIDFGETKADSIVSPCDIKTYVFDALQGDVVWVRLSTEPTMDPEIDLYGPDGSYVAETFGPSPFDDQIDLPLSGTYTLIVKDWAGNSAYNDEDFGTDTGAYRLFIQRLNNPGAATAAEYGKTLASGISTPYEVDTYRFQAMEGDTVLVRIGTDVGLDPEFAIWGPGGSFINSSVASGPGTAAQSEQMPFTGTYTLTVKDYTDVIFDPEDRGHETGNYWLYVQRLNNPGSPVQLGFGQSLSAHISAPFEVDTYRFDALQGDVVQITMSTDTGLDPELSLHGPDGAFIDGYDAPGPGSVTIDTEELGETGTYTVLAFNGGSGKETGRYTISLTLTAGDPGSMSVAPMEGLHAAGLIGGPFSELTKTYTLRNDGGFAVQWSLAKTQDWLDIASEGGTLAAGASQTVNVSIRSDLVENFPVGTFTDTLTFTNLTEANRQFVRIVSVRVDPIEGILDVTPSGGFEFSGPPGGPFEPSGVTYSVTNIGEKTMNWRAAKTAYWLSISPDHGTLEPGAASEVGITLTEIAEGLFEGVRTETIALTNQSNGYGNTSREIVLAIGVSPSQISVQVSRAEIILGEPLFVSGQITPAPCDAGAWVDIVLNSPDGEEIHQSVVANALGEFSYPVACGDIHRSGYWAVRASWNGDRCLGGATSTGQTVEVSKAASRVTVDAGSRAVKLGDMVDISGKFTPDPDCGVDLTGLKVKLLIFGPEGKSEIRTVTTSDRFGHFVLHDYPGFNALGLWSVEAFFVGDEAYEESSSEVITVQVVETAGYAVVVEGRIESGEGLASHHKTASFVYEQLKLRGLLDDDIYYLGYGADAGVDGVPSKIAVQYAVTEWARNKMNQKPANLYIVFVDHGLEERFFIDPEEFSSAELGAWLDTLQNGLLGQAAVQEIVVILGFCRSGSFLNELAGWNRVVMTSAAPHESSYKGPLDPADPMGIRDGEFFVTEFFKSASVGKDVLTCFREAVLKTETFTSRGTGETNAPYEDDSRQHPLLEDNADGNGENRPSGDPGYDGALSRRLFVGVSSVTGNAPGDVQVTDVSPTEFIGSGTSTVPFWARVDNNQRMRSLWLEVKAPGYEPGAGGTEQIEMDLPRHIYGTYNQGQNRYEWSNVSGFEMPGTYQIFFFARDDVTGNESSLKQTILYKADAGNQAPGTFDLLAPSEGAETRTVLMLDWGDSVDPDEDPLTYTVEISETAAFSTIAHRAERLTASYYFVAQDSGLKDLTTYYWRVTAIDMYGASTQSNQVLHFHTDNTNVMTGWISGRVYNAVSNQSITSAEVKVGSLRLNTTLNGYYLGESPPGTFQVEVLATGYNQKTVAGVVIPQGAMVTRDFGLSPTAVPGDVTGDGVTDLADAILTLKLVSGISAEGGSLNGDVNQDGRIGIQEAIFILQTVGGLR